MGRRAGGIVLAALAAAAISAPSFAQDAEIAGHRASERTTFTDAEIIEGFLKIAFGAELHTAGRVDRIRKYDGPVRVYVDNRASPRHSAHVGAVIADIRARIRHLDIDAAGQRRDANVVVTLVRSRDLAHTIRMIYGIDRARQIQRSLQPQCLSGFRKDESYRIRHSDVIVVADAGDFILYDCLYEELLQALGPINDDPTVPWSMFNDNVRLGYFGLYDQHLLNILYDPHIRPGMTRAEVEALLPKILPSVRAWVAKVNKLPR
jgi:hypothetical protein